MKRKKTPAPLAPEIIDVDSRQFDSLLARLEAGQPETDDHVAVRQLAQAYKQLFALIGDKQTTIARLRKMLFGASTELAENVLGDEASTDAQAAASTGDEPAVDDAPSSSSDATAPGEKPRTPGHGRRAADDYPGAIHQDIGHPTLSPGDSCPDCAQGTLYAKKPIALVRFVGQAPLQATVYQLQRMRCSLCGKTFTAPAPAEASEKYDPSVAAMIGLMKYGSGLPFNRIDRLQENCQVPLPASTQWQLVAGAATLLFVAYEELIRQAAQGEVLHNDDTTIKILALLGERAKKNPPADDDQPKRTGLFTSGVVALRQCGDAMRRVALFFSGRKHAGENLERVLRQRAAELAAPIHMCDGLARNLPGELKTILANCLAHGRRNFVELHDRFPKECRHVIEAFKIVYRNDKIARQEKLSAAQRLVYHQEHSRGTMDDLKAWLERVAIAFHQPRRALRRSDAAGRVCLANQLRVPHDQHPEPRAVEHERFDFVVADNRPLAVGEARPQLFGNLSVDDLPGEMGRKRLIARLSLLGLPHVLLDDCPARFFDGLAQPFGGVRRIDAVVEIEGELSGILEVALLTPTERKTQQLGDRQLEFRFALLELFVLLLQFGQPAIQLGDPARRSSLAAGKIAREARPARRLAIQLGESSSAIQSVTHDRHYSKGTEMPNA
jgi:transposase